MKFNPKTGEPYRDPSTGEPYVEHEYSDTLMALILKSIYPEKYKEKGIEVHSSASSNNFTVSTEQLKDWQERRKAHLNNGCISKAS